MQLVSVFLDIDVDVDYENNIKKFFRVPRRAKIQRLTKFHEKKNINCGFKLFRSF